MTRKAWISTLVAILLIDGFLFLFVCMAVAKAHVPGCHSRACDQRIHAKRRTHWKHTHIWQYRWNHLGSQGRHWTRCVSGRESGNRRIARESGFLSYFQWVLSTWHMAGGTGNPENAAWFEQAVRAWHWHLSHPTGQWPNTGERGICG